MRGHPSLVFKESSRSHQERPDVIHVTPQCGVVPPTLRITNQAVGPDRGGASGRPPTGEIRRSAALSARLNTAPDPAPRSRR
ncbi:hypothetical protein SBRY_100128 [Actinacidiphila bryophytorum]|uniref:Uncharacterized protein n=1 Tax=Actinacidiphila bryophytorum TaxID=1436133 RepID=A0A9W4GWZ6_9ACTN|nr:hypothetical protein SBRY_100128 [Actinacidiphila bryophytorum]